MDKEKRQQQEIESLRREKESFEKRLEQTEKKCSERVYQIEKKCSERVDQIERKCSELELSNQRWTRFFVGAVVVFCISKSIPLIN